jgi:hypothetical protein
MTQYIYLIPRQSLSTNMVIRARVFFPASVNPSTTLFMWYCSSTAGFLPRAVTMPDDTEAAALRARLKAIVKEAEDAKAQATATCCRV